MNNLKRKLFVVIILINVISFLENAQTILINEGATIYVPADADICAGVYGNVTGNLIGDGTECGELITIPTFPLTVSIEDGWNMVSIPGLHPVDQNVITWWSGKDPSANVYRYSGGYQSITNAIPGQGYWMKHIGDNIYNTGDEWPAGGIQIVPHDPLFASVGWNLIGGYENIVSTGILTTTPPGLIEGAIFSYSGGYQVAENLVPGYGYWIKLTDAGQININDSTIIKSPTAVNFIKKNWGRIIISDHLKRRYTLYAVEGEVDLNQYELPPKPPEGMFDIRFASGRIAEDINKVEQTIELTGAKFPLAFKVDGIDVEINDVTGKLLHKILNSGDELVISDNQINRLLVKKESIPVEYDLKQNYPNPFNPVTVITYNLPSTNLVTLKVYSLLGEEVITLVNETKEAGSYEVSFDARSLPSGIYLYRLNAGDYIATKKMLLLK